MRTVDSIQALRSALPKDLEVGFVPTMGALHDGHVSLVQASKARGLFTVASIFVNPTQFNDPGDFEKYPVDLEGDLARLLSANCDLVFLPARETIYPPDQKKEEFQHDFGNLETVFEGAFRPGHFRGVGEVVHILFSIVQPDVAFFGQKDLQQLAVIHRLVEEIGTRVEIVGMPTIREADGLAMSSRNRRLSSEERRESTTLYAALQHAKAAFGKEGLPAIFDRVKAMFRDTRTLKLEYFDIIEIGSFKRAEDIQPSKEYYAIIAAYAGEVRLIDNLKLVS
jgi:pantoate--beta-alanine ligase